MTEKMDFWTETWIYLFYDAEDPKISPLPGSGPLPKFLYTQKSILTCFEILFLYSLPLP